MSKAKKFSSIEAAMMGPIGTDLARKPEKPKSSDSFTGVAYSCEAYKQQNTFNNFRILTMFIVDDEIVHVDRSDPHATFEVIDICDVKMHRSVNDLNSRYRDGLKIGLSGEDRDALLKRLDPETIKKIAPALGLKGAK